MSAALLSSLLALAAEQPDPALAFPPLLARLRDALGAASAALWVARDEAVERRWAAGAAQPAEPRAAAAARLGQAIAEAGVLALPLRAGGRVHGALVVTGGGADAAALAPVADLLALQLAQEARVGTLVVERDTSAAQADAQRRFASRVVDSLPLGVYVVDRDYRVHLWNRKREVGTDGIAREEAIGRVIFDVLPRQNAALMREEFDEVFDTGQLKQLQMESRSTGELRTYRLTKIPMRGDDGAVSHVITVGEDVTEWKAALERSAQAEKLAAIGQLAAGVMHEINNPLATIAACAETMTLTLADLPKERAAPPGFGEYLRIIDHEVHRCRKIADGLLNFSRAKPVQRVPLGINAVAEQTLFLLKHHSRFKKCVLRLDLEDGAGPAVLCDPDQLTQVAMALLLNAADAVIAAPPADDGDEPPSVTLRTRATPDGAVLEVQDGGVGMSREVQAKIFEPFFTTKEPGKGTGLGLAICYGIVRDHGGRIVVDSAPGAGSTFRVILPTAA